MTTSQKNKRLSKRDRAILTEFAAKQVSGTEPTDALDAAYELAADAISAKVMADNPPRDMKVLKRYNLANKDQCIFISQGKGWGYSRFRFREGDGRVHLRAIRWGGCDRNPILLEGEAAAAFGKYTAAAKAWDAAISDRLGDYKALIQSARTFNELVDAWPAAEGVRAQIFGTGTAIQVMNPDVARRIKQDAAYTPADAVAA